MPIPATISGLLVEQAANAVVKALKGAYSKSPWARDNAMSQTVERRIHVLVERVATLARNVPPEGLEGFIEPLIQDFRNDLLEAKISQADADDVVGSVRAQIRATVLEPLRDVVAIQARLNVLERENTEQGRRLDQLEDNRKQLEAEKSRMTLIVYGIFALLVLNAILNVISQFRR